MDIDNQFCDQTENYTETGNLYQPLDLSVAGIKRRARLWATTKREEIESTEINRNYGNKSTMSEWLRNRRLNHK